MAKALLSLVIQDTDSDTSTVSVFVSVGTGDTVESLTTDYALLFWNVVRPLITGVLIDVNITVKPDFSGWTNNTADVLSDVQEKAIFTIRICGNERPIKLSLPTVDELIFENAGAGKFVDTTNSDYQAFKFALENGVVDGGIGATDSHESDVCEVIFGEQLFRGK